MAVPSAPEPIRMATAMAVLPKSEDSSTFSPLQ
jgi:hypothetical protein